MAPSKRPHNVIDLTGDSPDRSKSKHPRTTASSSLTSTAPSSRSTQITPFPSSRVLVHGQRQRVGFQQRNPIDDEPELLDLTQADDGPVFGLYGTINNKIVGVRYYNGIVSPGEVVILRREPYNQ